MREKIQTIDTFNSKSQYNVIKLPFKIVCKLCKKHEELRIQVVYLTSART